MLSIWYALFVFCVIMPLNGILIVCGEWWTIIGIILIITQIPWFVKLVLR